MAVHKKKAEIESSSTSVEDLLGTIMGLSENVNQQSTMMVQIQKTLERMETRIANLESKQCADNHQDCRENIRNQ